MRIFAVTVIFIFVQLFLQAQPEGFGSLQSYNDDLRSVAPNIPLRPEGKLFNIPNYRSEMDKWVADFPQEYEAALVVDPKLRDFSPESSSPVGNLSINKNEPSDMNPAFMLYPVNSQMPVLIRNGNPDLDEIIYERKLQHWYYKFDKQGYEQRYGSHPILQAFPQPINHPSEFSFETDTASINGYYPEFGY